MTISYVVVRPSPSITAACSTVSSNGVFPVEITFSLPLINALIVLLTEERYLRPLYKEPLENGLFRQTS
jgi:hypothetical protein